MIYKKKEIGSFYEEPNKYYPSLEETTNIFSYLGKGRFQRFSFFDSGRSAFAAIIDEVESFGKNKVCLLPAYLCSSMVTPFIQKQWEVHFYSLKESLCPNTASILKLIKEFDPSIIVLLPYYGEDTTWLVYNSLREWRELGGIIIEDLTQSMFLYDSHFELSNYQIISLRKWFAIPDGGVAVGLLDIKDRDCNTRFALTESKAQTLKLRYLSGKKIDKESFLQLHREAGRILGLNKEIYRMSLKAYNSMTLFDVYDIFNRRKDNINTLKINIHNKKIKPLFNNLSSSNAGLYYPVIVDNRDEFQNYLQRNNIYAPVLWPKPDLVTINDSVLNLLYNHVLCIPCDHRYNADDMKYIANIINEY